MLLHTTLSASNPSRFDLRIAKFFQVVFIGRPSNTGSRQVDVFTAVIASTSGYLNNLPSVAIASKLGGDSPSQLTDVGDIFYPRIDILQQFWGERSATIHQVEELNRFADIDEDALRQIAQIWPGGSTAPFVIFEPVKNPTPVLVIPSSPTIFEKSGSKLTFSWPGSGRWSSTNLKLATGIWQHATFYCRDTGPDEMLLLEHVIAIKGIVQFDEVRIYYVLPEGSDLQSQSGTLSYGRSPAIRTPDGQLGVEVHELFSQPYTEYFPAWNKLGIKRCTLVRLNPSTEFESLCRDQFAQEIQIQMRVIDAASVKRRDRKALIASIVFATATATGIDQTRIGTVVPLLPWSQYTTGTLWWILMCLSLLPAFLPPPKPLYPRTARALSWIAFCLFMCWTSAAFFLGSVAGAWARGSLWAPYIPPGLCILSLAILATQRINIVPVIARVFKRGPKPTEVNHGDS